MGGEAEPRESNDIPAARLCLGITGHRDDNGALARNRPAVEAALAGVFDALDGVARTLPAPRERTRLHSLLAPGADTLAMEAALARGWEVVSPLPFGLDLSIALNCRGASAADARALIEGGGAPTAAVAAQATTMRDLASRVELFELAEQDDLVAARFLAAAEAPAEGEAAAAFRILASERAAVAARVMIEQADLLIAIWDGDSPGAIGGTRHSIESALYHGAPVIWIDASSPGDIRLLLGPDALERIGEPQDIGEIARTLAAMAGPADADQAERARRFHAEPWRSRSSRLFHSYRRVEAVFGGRGEGRRFRGLVAHYESPERIAEGSAADFLAAARAVPGAAPGFVERLHGEILRRFARADGLSTYFSDAYRGGMVMNFILSALAVVAGAAYLPLVGVDWKWPFAFAELMLLLSIVGITVLGRRRRWHGRWLETRRMAEYLRHAPMMLMLGVARPAARWPQGSSTQWPEYYARQALRAIGLPHIVVTQAYLRAALADLLLPHVVTQRDYHRQKAARLAHVHHRLDRLAETLFVLAILSVSIYLLLIVAGTTSLIPSDTAELLAKPLTFLGIALPALGGACAGIRYLGDFERFAAISEATAGKLDGVAGRIETLLAGAEPALHYAQVASIAHAVDDIVISEIESWQSVFALKTMAVPV